MSGFKATIRLFFISLVLSACNTHRVKDVFVTFSETIGTNLIVTEIIFNTTMNQFDTISHLYQIERIKCHNPIAFKSDFVYTVFNPHNIKV